MSIKQALATVLALGAASAVQAAEPATTPATTFSGKAYVDFTYRNNHDDTANVAADKGAGTSFDLKRFYLTVDHSFDDVWGARLRTDAGNEVNGKFDVFVKNAYVEARVSPALVLRAGAADLPWFSFVEDLYGYRYVEPIVEDRTKFGTSADWGLHAGGKLGQGLFGYALSVVNGRGYGDPTRTQGPTVEGRVSAVPVKGLTLAVGAQAGTLGQRVVGTATPRTATRFDAVVAWVSGPVRLGVTAFQARNYDKAIVTSDTVPTDKALGGSAWGSYSFDPVSVFARVDYVQPKKDTDENLKDLYVNGGLAYKAAKPVDIALVYKYEQVKGGSIATSNGTVGSSVAGGEGTYQEIGLFGQYVF
jgi:hypothetical protein